jgi:gas vesicle protein
MSNSGRTTLVFLTGLGIGAGIAALFAPRSGEETREWIAYTANRKFRILHRKGGRSIKQLQYALSKGEEKLTEVLRSGKETLESVAAKLD